MEEKQIHYISIDKIKANQFQPRSAFSEEKLVELKESIKEHGVLQPVIVRVTADNEFELVAGERRYRASLLAKLEKIPAIIENYDDLKTAEIAIIENIQRENLTPIEEAVAFQKLIEIHGITQEQLGKRLGKSQGSIANKLRLLKLPTSVKTALLGRHITERHARALLGLSTEEEINEVLEKVIENKHNVSATEKIVQKRNGRHKEKNERIQKGITQDIRIAVNTIKKAVDMVKQTGVQMELVEESDEKEHRLVIKFIKKAQN